MGLGHDEDMALFRCTDGEFTMLDDTTLVLGVVSDFPDEDENGKNIYLMKKITQQKLVTTRLEVQEWEKIIKILLLIKIHMK